MILRSCFRVLALGFGMESILRLHVLKIKVKLLRNQEVGLTWGPH